ncbi:MAG TPA: class I SAM-dependent methyltransferase [Kofleriaceae bacterium]|nr:class I SAM-dependent methyltransferase [Kofleriaceae bacterium]
MDDEKLAPAQTLAGYDRWAKTYDATPNPLVAATAWVLDRAPLACAGADVIELGCGTGRNAKRALDEGARSYTGVDGSRGMLDLARSATTNECASWIEADLLVPWQPPRLYDLALVVLVLEHLAELDTLAKTLAHAVRAGGRCRIVDLHPDRIEEGAVAHFKDGPREVVFPSIAHPVAEVRAALERVGFTVEIEEWIADDALIAAVPKAAKYRGRPLVLDVRATRR